MDEYGDTGRSALEVILTTLHAGGKFETDVYKTSGGLHGVGASVVNALSSEMAAASIRGGHRWEQYFARGEVVEPLKKVGREQGHGTAVFFRPDPEIFPKTEFDPDEISSRLETASYIHRGLTLSFTNEAADETVEFHHENGLTDYCRRIAADENRRPVHNDVFALTKTANGGAAVDVVLQWTEAPSEQIRSYVNGIPTPAGGTHESGLKAGIGKAVRT